MRHSVLAAFSLLVLCTAASAQDQYPTLPAGEGRDLLIKTCSSCHSPARVDSERRDLDGYQALMVEMQGNGLNAPQDDLDTIAQYLAKAFPPSLPRKPPG